MPDLRLSEVHLPELHLPEMTRDDIVRAVSDVRRDIDLSRFDPRRTEPAESRRSRVEMPRIDLSRIDLSKIDLPKALAATAQAAGIVRPPRRSRMPLVIGGFIALGLVGLALLTSPMVRPRLDEATRKARARIDAMREAREEDVEELDLGADVVAVPIEPDAFLPATPDAADAAIAAEDETPALASEAIDETVSEAITEATPA